MFITNLNLSPEEWQQKEALFPKLVLDYAASKSAYDELKEFFIVSSADELIKKYRTTYWRWYVWLTWYRLNNLTNEDLVKVFASQVPMAVSLGFDVGKLLMSYLVANNYFEGNIESEYLKIKDSFLNSQVMAGLWKGEEITTANLFKEIEFIAIENDTLKQAEFESKLRQILFSNDLPVSDYISVDIDEAVKNFIDLAIFFSVTGEDEIVLVVTNYLNSTNTSQENKDSVSTDVDRLEGKNPLSLGVIRSQIESEFKKDSEGNFEDIEGVMEKLAELAEENNDSNIAEMIYFDEKENKFAWKE